MANGQFFSQASFVDNYLENGHKYFMGKWPAASQASYVDNYLENGHEYYTGKWPARPVMWTLDNYLENGHEYFTGKWPARIEFRKILAKIKICYKMTNIIQKFGIVYFYIGHIYFEIASYLLNDYIWKKGQLFGKMAWRQQGQLFVQFGKWP